MPPWPAALAEAGYEIVRIEQPVTTASGKVTVDLVFVARSRGALLAVECKDGTVQLPQAARYDDMQPVDLIRTASITVPDPSTATLDVVYAVPGDHAASIVNQLAGVAPRSGVLVIDERIAWLAAPPVDLQLRAAFDHSIPVDLRAIPRLMLVDEQSPPSALAAALASELHAAIESGRESVTIGALVERVCWGWPRYGRAFRGRLVKKVEELLRDAQQADLSDVIKLERRTRESSEVVVGLRFRTSGAITQAGELRRSRAVRSRLDNFVLRVTGRPVPPSPGQLDLLSELDEPDYDEYE
jgi:hypothetical protein